MRAPVRRSIVWLVAAVLAGAACSPSDEDTATRTSSLAAPPSTNHEGATDLETDVASPCDQRPASTTAIAAPPTTPSYLIYGWEGVARVHDHGSERLIAEPVEWAAEDGAGGIVFRTVAEEPGWGWLPVGADRPARIDTSNRSWLTGLFLLFDGRPATLVSRGFDAMTHCEPHDFVEELAIRDLGTGDERFLMCHEAGPDAGDDLSSFGGALFSSVAWVAAGAGGSTSSMLFYDLDGNEVTVEHNPFAESCAPCHLSASLSPDGSLLSYALWPVSYWQQPEPSDGDYTRAHRAWYAEHQDIPTEIVVMELATGVEVFRTDVGADATLTDFDGRIVAVATATGRELFDIHAGETFTVPPAMTEPAAFWTVVLASLDNTVVGYGAAQRIAGDVATQHDVKTGVLWSDGFATLNPGFWAVFTGHFSSREEALAHCEALETGCYARYVATTGTIDPELGRQMLELRNDGLGLIRFGDMEHDVLALMEKLVGSAPIDPGDEAGWVEYVGWSEFGLFLGFSRQWADDYDGVGRFVGWQHAGDLDQLDLSTTHGVRRGTTTAELKAIYGDAFVVHTDPDACVTGGSEVSALLLGDDTGIVALLDDAGKVSRLLTGMQTGC